MLLTSIPAFLLYDLIALAAQDYVLFAAISISLLIHVGAYILAGYPHLNLKSRRTAALNVNFIVFFLALATGKQSGVEFLFVSLACVVFLPFERKEKSSTFFFVFLSLVLYIISQHVIDIRSVASPTLIFIGANNLRLISFLTSFGICCLSIGVTKKYYILAQDELDEEKARKIHQSRLSTLGEMASIVAHEIKNPVSTLGGLNEMSLEVVEKDPSIPGELVEFIRRSAKLIARINSIIGALNFYTRKAETIRSSQ